MVALAAIAILAALALAAIAIARDIGIRVLADRVDARIKRVDGYEAEAKALSARVDRIDKELTSVAKKVDTQLGSRVRR